THSPTILRARTRPWLKFCCRVEADTSSSIDTSAARFPHTGSETQGYGHAPTVCPRPRRIARCPLHVDWCHAHHAELRGRGADGGYRPPDRPARRAVSPRKSDTVAWPRDAALGSAPPDQSNRYDGERGRRHIVRV